jgi:hypothetical protein
MLGVWGGGCMVRPGKVRCLCSTAFCELYLHPPSSAVVVRPASKGQSVLGVLRSDQRYAEIRSY